MPDWRDDDFEDLDGGSTHDEGVRILGDDAAAEVPSRSRRRRRRGRGSARGEGETWSASSEGFAPPAEREVTSPSGLPHWSEPPTGEVPRSLGGEPPETSSSDEDFESWSTLATPRFRTGASDWAEGDFQEGDLVKDDATAVGALADDVGTAPPPRRRRRSGRARGVEPAPEAYDTELAEDEGGWVPGPPGALEGPPLRPRVEPTRHEPAADMATRVVTGTILGGIALVFFVIGRGASVFFVTVVVGLAAIELYEAFRRAGYHVATILGLLGCVAIVPVAYDQGERAFPMFLFLMVTFGMLWYLAEVVRSRPTVNVALTLLGFVYVGCLGAFGGMLLGLSRDGVGYLLGVVICAIGADVAGYAVGSSIGRTPLLPRISPNKTVEGLIGGAVAALFLGGLVGEVLHPWANGGIGDGLALGLVVAIMAPIGDLCASMLKRDLGIKDFSTFLPGHGGFLDRFDAVLFCLPAAYYLALYLAT